MNAARIPQEIADEISSYSSISDVASMEKGLGVDVLRRRSNPAVYLGRYFKHPVAMLAAMESSGAIIYGPRALEYFVPDKANLTTGWNFCCPPEPGSVATMMFVLHECGVEWEIREESFDALVRGPSGTTVGVPTDFLYCAHKCTESMWLHSKRNSRLLRIASAMYQKVCSMLDVHPDHGEPLGPSHSTAVIKRKDEGGDDISDMNVEIRLGGGRAEGAHARDSMPSRASHIIHGSITRPHGGTDRVAMVVRGGTDDYGRPRGVLSAMDDYAMSHVHCFISGWCAVRLYPQHSDTKTSKVSRRRVPDEEQRLLKAYAESGYKFKWRSAVVKAPAPRVSILDGCTDMISFLGMYSSIMIDRSLVKTVRERIEQSTEFLRMVSWYPSGGIVLMDSGRELEEIYSPFIVGRLPLYTLPSVGVIMEEESDEYHDTISIEECLLACGAEGSEALRTSTPSCHENVDHMDFISVFYVAPAHRDARHSFVL